MPSRYSNSRHSICDFLLLVFISIAASVWSPHPNLAANTVIDNFNDTNTQSRWAFYNGVEYGAARGSFTALLNTTNGDGVGQLAIDVSQGGLYVIATRGVSPALPTTTQAITFQAKLAPGLVLFLRIMDATGQTLQYPLQRPLEYLNSNTYYTATFPLGVGPQYFWGGSNNGIINGGITNIGIGLTTWTYQDLASNSYQATPKGALIMDNLTAVSSNSLSMVELPPILGTVQGTPASVNSLGVAIHFTNNPPALAAAAAVGAHFVRMDLFWSYIEQSPGKYNFTDWDPLVSGATALGLKTILILAYENTLYTGASSPPTNTAAVTAFANFAKAAAQHYAGKGMTYEIWNEPNATNFWNPVSATNFANLLKAATASIKSADSNALVVSGGIGTDFAYLNSVLDTGAIDAVDAVGVHPYNTTSIEVETDVLVYFQSLLQARRTAPSSLWITECGVSSAWFGPGNLPTNLQTQAQLVLRQVLVNWGAGRGIDAVYDLIDDGTSTSDTEANFGLYSQSLSPLPAGQALQYLHQSTAGSSTKIQGLLQFSDTRAHGLLVTGLTNQCAVVWTELSTTVGLTLPPGARVTDMYGSSVAVSNNTLLVGNAPQYVFFPYLPPANVVASAGVNKVVLSYSAPPGVKFYTIYRSRASGGPYSKIATTTSAKYTDLNVVSGITYYYVVTMCNGGVLSAYSRQVAAVPLR